MTLRNFGEFLFHFAGGKALKRLILGFTGHFFLCGVSLVSSTVAEPLQEWQELSSSLLWEGRAGLHRGVAFLLAEQKPDGSWADDPVSTAFAVLALSNGGDLTPLPVENAIEQGQRYLTSWIDGDGLQDGNVDCHKNEVVAVAMLALLRRHNDNVRRQIILRAREYLLAHQNMDTSAEDWNYGGFPAAPGEEPELMTTQWALEAILLTDFLVSESQKVDFAVVEEKMSQRYQAALRFIKSCQRFAADIEAREKDCDQKLSGAFNPVPMAIGNEYSPAKNRLTTETLRLHTLAGMKVLINSRGMEGKDERLQAAIDWLRENWREALWLRIERGETYKKMFFLSKVFKTLEPLHPNVIMAGDEILQWRVLTVTELLRRQGGDGGWGSVPAGRDNGYNSAMTTAWAVLALTLIIGSQ